VSHIYHIRIINYVNNSFDNSAALTGTDQLSSPKGSSSTSEQIEDITNIFINKVLVLIDISNEPKFPNHKMRAVVVIVEAKMNAVVPAMDLF